MKRLSVFAFAAVMTFGLRADEVAAPAAVAPVAEVAAAPVVNPTPAEIKPAAAPAVKPSFFANALNTVKGGASTVYNTTKAGVWCPFTKNGTWANFGKTAAVVASVYVGYKVYKAAFCEDGKCCVSKR